MSEINKPLNKSITIPISQVPTYARTQTVTAPNGEVRSWSDVLESNPNYEIWVDSETLEPIQPLKTDTSSQDLLENQASNYLLSSSKNNNKGFDIYNGANPKTLWMRRALDDPDNPGNLLADLTADTFLSFLTGGTGKLFLTSAKYAAKELLKQSFKNIVKNGVKTAGKKSWKFIKGPARKFAGYTAGALAVDEAANMAYQGITGSNNHYMDDAANALGINNIKNSWIREPVKFAFYGTNPTGFIPGTNIVNATQRLFNYSKNNISNQLLNHTLRRGMTLKRGKDLDYALRDIQDYNARKQMEGIDAAKLYGLDYAEDLVNSGLIDSYAGRPTIGGNNKYYVRTSAPGNEVNTGVRDVVDNTLTSAERPVFLSAGEPWKEFTTAPTIHEFPFEAFGRRSSVDWNGVPTGIDVFDVYNGYTGPNPGYISGVSHSRAYEISPRSVYTGFQTTVPSEEYVKGFMNYPHTTYERRMLGNIPYVQKTEYIPFNSGLSNIPKREMKLSFYNPELVAATPVIPKGERNNNPRHKLTFTRNDASLNLKSTFVWDDELDDFVEINATTPFEQDPLLTLIEQDPEKFINDQYLRNAHYIVYPEEAKKSEILRKLSQMTGKEQDEFFISNINNSFELMHQRGLDGGYNRLRQLQNEALQELTSEERAVMLDYLDAQIDPKYFNPETNSFDYNLFYLMLPDLKLNVIDEIVKKVNHNKIPQTIFPNLTEVGIKRAYTAPIRYNRLFNNNAGANVLRRTLVQGKDTRLLLPHAKAHEIHHLLSNPNKEMDFTSILIDEPNEYLHERKLGNESTARYSLLLNALGIKTDRVLLPEEFNFLSRNYTNIPYPGINNYMTEFFNYIKDPKKFIKWASSSALALPLLINTKNE